MALVIIAPNMDLDEWVRHIRRLEPGIDLRIWPDTGNPDDIDFAMVYTPPAGVFQSYPNLKGILYMGAGVDALFRDLDFPKTVPLARTVDARTLRSIGEYVVMTVLSHCRNYHGYIKNQAAGRWDRRPPLMAEETPIGLMGVGEIGSSVARQLRPFDFPLQTWSRTPKRIAGVDSFSGQNELRRFLARSRILVCLLPLTPETRGILNRDTLPQLPRGAFVINVARGEHVVEADLIEALESGHLAGACLDVFPSEPLPAQHPFWHHPDIIVTPHVASFRNPETMVPQMIDNYHRSLAGEKMENLVNPHFGY